MVIDMKYRVFYFDDDDNIVDKDKATHSIIQNYDDNGNFIGETFVSNKKNPQSTNGNNMGNITSEDIDRMIHERYVEMKSKLR